MQLQDYYRQIRQQLGDSGIETPDLDARAFISHYTGLEQADFIMLREQILDSKVIENINADVEKRLKGEPVSRILGVREFWGLDFKVTPDVLDPRPDTETLIEAALKWVRLQELDKKSIRIIDLGTGTGCILIALLSELPLATALAIDVSEEALAVARYNAEQNGVFERLEIRQGNWTEGLDGENFDLIVSNPPYICAPDIENLSIEVKNHDPILALSGGNDGLDCYKKIISYGNTHLNSSNRMFLEIGFDQQKSVSRLVEESNLCVCDSHPDIAGIPRVLEICRGDK